MTYNELLKQFPQALTIPSLGGRTSLTIYKMAGGLMVENSKGSTYVIGREDWINAKRIRAAFPRNPWKTAHYTEIRECFTYSLVYAAALLRHVEPVEEDRAPLVRFHRRAQVHRAY